MTNRYLDVTNDLAFKKVFSDKDVMRDFLNGILRLSGSSAIEEIEFVPTEEIPDLGQGKKSIFDLKCKDQEGNWFVVEMQNRRRSHFLKRVQFYASHTYVSQLPKGDSHKGLMPVILVAVSRENLFPDDIEYISYHKTKEETTNKQHLFELSYVFIELDKFKKKPEELKTIEDYWIYFLAESRDDRKPPETIKDPWVLKAYTAVEKFNWTEAQYDAYIRARLLSEAEELTIEESLKKGIEKGRAEGIEKGKADGLIEVARKMLSKNKSLEEIAEITGLNTEKVKELV